MRIQNIKLNTIVSILTLVSVLGFVFGATLTTQAAPNLQINYQGKLTDASNIAVPDGTYNMRFWLLTSPTIATTSAVWTESLTSGNKVQVTNGLFSIMLGSTSPLTSVDFNQTLYLGVEIGGTTTPGWDGEMSPRKILGAVPAAFEADRLDGLTSSQFVRSDTTATIASSSASALLTVTQNGTGDIFNLFDGAAEVFSVLDGGYVGVGTSTPTERFTVAGNALFGGNVTATGTLTVSGLTTLGSFIATNGTTTNATSTNLRVSSLFTLGNDAISDLTGTGLQISGSALTLNATGDWTGTLDGYQGSELLGTSNWLYDGSRLSPSTTVGIGVFASSTIGGGTGATGLTISGGATTTGNAYFAGNVGIGTSAPTNQVDIIGAGSFQVRRVSDSLNVFKAVPGAISADLGEGTVTFTNNTGGVITDGFVQGNGGRGIAFSAGGPILGTNTLGAGGFIGYNDSSNWTAVWAGSGMPLVFGIDGSEALRVDSNKYVGIGTSTPDSLLTVASTTAAGTTGLFSVGTTSSIFNVLANGNVGIGSSTPSGTLTIMAPQTGTALFIDRVSGGSFGSLVTTNNNGVWNFTDGGSNVFSLGDANGIGLNVNNGSSVSIHTSAAFNGGDLLIGSRYVNIGTTTANAAKLFVQGTGTVSPFTVASSSGSTFLTVLASGNVGIGTSSPSALLSIASSTGAAIFSIANDGTLTLSNPGIGYLHTLNDNGSGVLVSARNGTHITGIDPSGLRVTSGLSIGWTQNSAATLSMDTGFSRLSANKIAAGNGTAGDFTGTFIAGKIGVGSSTPSSLLSISNSISTTANTPLLTIASTTGGTATSTLMTVLASGNVGIGTTTPNEKLTITGNLSFDGNGRKIIGTFYPNGSYSTMTMFQDPTLNNPTYVGVIPASGASNSAVALFNSSDPDNAGILFLQNGDVETNVAGLTLFKGGTGTAPDFGIYDQNFSRIFTIKQNGSVGIGSTTPSRLLTVNGDIYGANITATGTATFANLLVTGSSTIGGGTGATGLTINGTATTTNLVITALSDGCLSSASGLVTSSGSPCGSGSGSSNWLYDGSRLSPSTTVGLGVFASSTIGDGTGAGGLTVSGNSTTTGNAYFVGNVGVGDATAPSTPLHVRKDQAGQTQVIVENQNTSGIPTLKVRTGTSATTFASLTFTGSAVANTNFTTLPSAALLYTGGTGGMVLNSADASAPMIFAVGGYEFTDEKMRITSAGLVGIGSTTPSRKLTVNGDIYGAGLTATGTVTFSGMTGGILTTSSSGVVSASTTVGSAYLDSSLILSSEIDTSSELAGILGDETGTAGNVVFSTNPLLAGFRSNASSTIGGGTGATGLTIYGTATTTNLKVTALTAARGVFTGADGLFTTAGTSQYLIDALSNETGTGNAVFSTNPLLAGFRSNASSTIGDGTGAGGLTIYGNATTTGLMYTASLIVAGNATTTGNAYFGGNVGIETAAPYSRLTVSSANISQTWSQAGSGLTISGASTPALAALSPNRVAFIDSAIEGLRTYEFNGSIWSQAGTGTTISTAGIPALAALSPNRVAFIDATLDELRTYEFNGNTWTQVGTGLSITSTAPALAALSPNRVAFIDAVSNELRTYEFNGSTWSLVGTGLSITSTAPALAALSPNRVAFTDSASNELRTYEFNGSTWSQVGSARDLVFIGVPALATLSPNRVAFIDSFADTIRTYEFNGSGWSLLGSLDLGSGGTPALAALSPNRVAFFDSTNIQLRTYQFASPIFAVGDSTDYPFLGVSDAGYVTAEGLAVRTTLTVGQGTAATSSTSTPSFVVSGLSSFLNNVGIGTTTTQAQLSINPTFANGSIPSFFIGSSTTHLIVTSLGNVGIGSTTPSRLLTVNGDIYSANITATGTATFANLLVTGSSTIGGGTGATGLTINGTATTTDLKITSLSDGCLSSASGLVTSSGLPCGSGSGSSNWLLVNGALAPSTTVGVTISASSTIGGGTGATGLTVYGTATTTNLKVTALTAARGVFTGADGLFTTTGTSQYLIDALSDETGTGNAVFSTDPLLAGFRSNASSTIGGGTGATGLTVYGGATTTGNTYLGGSLSLGSTTPEGYLTLSRTALSGAQVAGIKEYLQFSNSVASAIYYGDNAYIVNSPTATSTLVGKIIRIEDNSQLGNTVRGLEVQAHRGTTTKGENTGISGFGRTFGVRGTTEGDAGDTYIPAGVMAESRGTTQGNALRAYSGTITSSSLAYLFHDTSVFTGTGLLMNFGNTTGSFASTSSKFIDLQNAGTSKFTVTAHGTTTIGDGTTANMAGLQIGYGGICVDNDGTCTASTTGKITSVSSATGNSDLAEMYFSSDTLEPGEIVMASGALSIARAERADREHIIGVVSTKPGLIMGYDDSSLVSGQQGYPVALKGRVPIKLSIENGPIQKGDRIALSTIPGVGMKATQGDIVVGIALEDFNGDVAYSSGYINQFGDDLVKAKLQPRNQNTDTRTQDGCSYGAGNEQGETPCVKEAVKNITPETVSVDTRTEALRELRATEASTMYTESGEVVTVGQALMFVDLDYYALETERNVLSELLATTTREIDGREETLWDRLKLLAENFVDGVLRVAGIRTNELCVGNTCVDEETFLRIVESAQVSGSTDSDSTDTTPPPSDAPTDTADTTDPTNDTPTNNPASGTTTEEAQPEPVVSGENSTPEIPPVTEEVLVPPSTEEQQDTPEVTNPVPAEEPVIEESPEPPAEPSTSGEAPSESNTEPTI